MLFFFFLFSFSIFADLFPFIKPDKPGLYDVTVDEDGNAEFVEIKKPLRGLSKVTAGESVTAWDFRKNTACSAINTVRDQKSCGGCWAFASTDVFGSTLCLNNQVDTTFSPQYLIDCPDTQNYGGHSYTQEGCQGGFPIIAFMTFNKSSGGGCPVWSCRPFTGSQNRCPSTCVNGSAVNKIRSTSKTIKYVDAYKVDLQTLRDLVSRSGPCVAEMKAYDDLSSYTTGVYEHRGGGNNYEGHAVTVYGFGTEGGKNYWLIKNSWGPTWGDGGFFKIRMGLNESGIEDNFYALFNNPTDYPSTVVPRPTQTTPGSYWDFDGSGGADTPDCPTYPSKKECESVAGCVWQADSPLSSSETHARARAHTRTRRSTRVHTQANADTLLRNEDTLRHHVRPADTGNSSLRRLGAGENCYDDYGEENEAGCKANNDCLWYDVSDSVAPFCDAWDYDCEDVQEDIPSYFPNCVTGGNEFGLVCTGTTHCTPSRCRDVKKNATCGAKAGCEWYNHTTRYYPFCDEAGIVCEDFGKAGCLYTEAYGLLCEVVDGECVTTGTCKNVDSAWGVAVPALKLLALAVLLFVTFL